jgi:predicted AlkP superfamily pyrophosphatase or phosphodiesterase
MKQHPSFRVVALGLKTSRHFLPLCLVFSILARQSASATSPPHVMVIVWDGMRADFITEQNAPTLHRLAREGVTFTHHHSSYPSATEVNGTVIATGAYPSHSGLIGNSEYRPAIDPLKPTHTEVLNSVRKGDQVSSNQFLRVPTTAEIVRAASRKAVVAGAKPVALLPDRALRESADHGANIFAGATLPPSLLQTIVSREGPFPKEDAGPKTRNDWTTSALIDVVWAAAVPDYSLLWLNQPDVSQHAFSPGSPEALAGIRNSDSNLARILEALESKGVRTNTDILVVSDHGCSTISASADVSIALTNAGFNAVREFQKPPRSGEILVVSNGGTVMIYVIGHDRETIQKLVRFFQTWQYTGVVFTREPAAGAFALGQIHLDSPESPDLVLSLRWTPEKNSKGTAGMLATDRASYGVGQGHHGSLSPYDMHNMLIAAGPDFRRNTTSDLPSGNVDIAPTVLYLLGIAPTNTMDGRILAEAITKDTIHRLSTERQLSAPELRPKKHERIETSVTIGTTAWREFLDCEQVNGVDYFDQGNGSQSFK